MIPNIGPLEIAIVAIVCLVVFGPRRLPELGRTAGRAIGEFRDHVGGTRAGAETDPPAVDGTPEHERA